MEVENIATIIDSDNTVGESSVVFSFDGEVTPQGSPNIQGEETQFDDKTIVAETQEQPDTEESKEVTPEVTQSNTTMINFIKKNIDSGKWQDLEMEDEEGNVTKVSELTNITEDQLNLIYSEQEKIREEEVQGKYLSVEGLDDTQKELIELIKAGGEKVVEALRTNPELASPRFSAETLEDEASQMRVYISDMVNKGLSEADATNLANIKKDNGELYGEAFAIKNKAKEDYVKEVQEAKQALEEQNKERVEKEKAFKNNLKEYYKSKSYTPSTIEKLVEAGTKKEGGNYAIDDLYFSIMEDPNKAADLIEFLVDPENFIKRYTIKAQNQTNQQNMVELRRISAVSKTKTGKKADNNLDTGSSPVFTFSN